MSFVSGVLSRVSDVLKSWAFLKYQASKRKEIQQFKNIKNIHELPAIFHYWSSKYLRPWLVESGFSSVDDFFATSLLESAPRNARFLSIGAGYCDTEIRVAKLLRAKGLQSFTFECLELNPHLLKRGQALAKAEDMVDCMLFTEADFNTWRPTTTYDGIMANHSLHHVVRLEFLFDNIKQALSAQGNFVANDMIGRNGHQRWPEALEVVRANWHKLPQAYRYNHQLRRAFPEFVDWDCSAEGFEGIRAQDILPLLLERFHFKYFFGFANVVGPFIDRGFGHNFDASADWDRSFIDDLHAIDEDGFMSGKLKPSQMFAVMTKAQVPQPRYIRGLSPEFSVRKV